MTAMTTTRSASKWAAADVGRGAPRAASLATSASRAGRTGRRDGGRSTRSCRKARGGFACGVAEADAVAEASDAENGVAAVVEEEVVEVVKEEEEEPVAQSDAASERPMAFSEELGGLSIKQVRALLEVVCDETDIAELQLDAGDCELKVRRKINYERDQADVAEQQRQVVPPAEGAAASATELQIAPRSASIMEDSMDEDASLDESVLYIESPKVGVMRRGLFNKSGKKVGKGPEPGDLVKKGQTLCYIEQLGTFCPIVTAQEGEITDFLINDGAPVEYLEPVVEVAPYFGSHIVEN